jgi:hypothetical protein
MFEGDTVTFHADFPFNQFLMNSLTIAAVTKTAGPFASADAVAKDVSSARLDWDQLKGDFCICGLGAGESIGFCDTIRRCCASLVASKYLKFLPLDTITSVFSMLSDTLYSKSIRRAVLTRKRVAFAISRLRKLT